MFGYRSYYKGAIAASGGGLPVTGLIHAWNMNSDPFEDQIGNADFVSSGTPVIVSGKVGSCLESDGSSTVGGAGLFGTGIPGGDVDFTFYIWFYLHDNTGSDQPIAGKIETGDQFLEWILYYSAPLGTGLDRFVFDTYDGFSNLQNTVAANTFGAPSLGEWNLIKISHDAVNNEIAIAVNNGTTDVTTGTTALTENTNCRLAIARRVNGGIADPGNRYDAIAYYNQVNGSLIDDEIWNSGNGIENV